jgi:hypothetical protein
MTPHHKNHDNKHENSQNDEPKQQNDDQTHQKQKLQKPKNRSRPKHARAPKRVFFSADQQGARYEP